MSNRLICVTQRALCTDDFLGRIRAIAEARPWGIILREKDLCLSAYLELAKKVQKICLLAGVLPILNWQEPTLFVAGCGAQVPFRHHGDIARGQMPYGVSVHAADEAKALQNADADWLLAGHIYDTQCKPGLPSRGLSFLTDVCQYAHQPVFAIGGISPERVPEVMACGAYGYAVMSPLMTTPDPQALIARYFDKEGV